MSTHRQNIDKHHVQNIYVVQWQIKNRLLLHCNTDYDISDMTLIRLLSTVTLTDHRLSLVS